MIKISSATRYHPAVVKIRGIRFRRAALRIRHWTCWATRYRREAAKTRAIRHRRVVAKVNKRLKPGAQSAFVLRLLPEH
jgi:hypothetical protein